MKNGIVVIIASAIISFGIGLHGYFIGKGVKESQPWHHLFDPVGLIRNIEIPEDLNLGFKIGPADGNGATFKLKIDDQAYEGHVNANESSKSIAGELSFEKIDLKDY